MKPKIAQIAADSSQEDPGLYVLLDDGTLLFLRYYTDEWSEVRLPREYRKDREC